jgi:predicted nucleotidyltransferase
MTVPAGLDMAPHEWEIVRAILRQHVPEREVWAFGSRPTGRAWTWSDLDLAIGGDTPLGAWRLGALREAFVESDLPWKVDLVDWPAVGEGFRRRVGDRRVHLQAADLAAAPVAPGLPSTPPAARAGRTP